MRRMYLGPLVAALTFTAIAVTPPGLHAQDEAPVNRVIERLHQGRPAIGTFSRTASPELDFAVIDGQYGECDIDAVCEALVEMREGDGAPVAPIVRIPLDARDAPQPVPPSSCCVSFSVSADSARSAPSPAGGTDVGRKPGDLAPRRLTAVAGTRLPSSLPVEYCSYASYH